MDTEYSQLLCQAATLRGLSRGRLACHMEGAPSLRTLRPVACYPYQFITILPTDSHVLRLENRKLIVGITCNIG